MYFLKTFLEKCIKNFYISTSPKAILKFYLKIRKQFELYFILVV